MHVIGYRRVSTEEQARNAHGLDAQRQTIEEHAARKGWTAEWNEEEGATGSRINPGLREALDLLRPNACQRRDGNRGHLSGLVGNRRQSGNVP
jgi:DNA invertase Pin-like site-specific DNA recombinase